MARVKHLVARAAMAAMAVASMEYHGAPWQRNIHMRRSMPRLTPIWHPRHVGKGEVGRYRQDERGIVHRLSRGERAQISQRGEI